MKTVPLMPDQDYKWLSDEAWRTGTTHSLPARDAHHSAVTPTVVSLIQKIGEAVKNDGLSDKLSKVLSAIFSRRLSLSRNGATSDHRLWAGHSGRFASALLGRTFQLLSKHRRTRVQGRARAFAPTCIQPCERTPDDYGHREILQRPKGFGFIQPEDGSRDVFVHATALERAGMRGLVEGQKVSFDTPKTAARQISKASTPSRPQGWMVARFNQPAWLYCRSRSPWGRLFVCAPILCPAPIGPGLDRPLREKTAISASPSPTGPPRSLRVLG